MPALYVTSTRPAIQGFPTDDDDFSGKTHIVVTGYSLSQIKAIWPHLRAYRKQRYNGFDSSHAQHRPASIFAREKAALLSADYEGAINKAEWLVVGQFDVFGLVTTGSNAQTDPLPNG